MNNDTWDRDPGLDLNIGDLVAIRKHHAYGGTIGVITKIVYDCGDGSGAGWAMFNEHLMFRFAEVEKINEAR